MRNAFVLAALILAAVLCFGVSGWMAGKPEFVAHSGDVSQGKGTPAGAPPGVRFVMVALGGFRGLLADALWMRASNLQDEGNFFEVAQLTEWITTLEPRSPEIWSYHAWNLAYNIGAMFPDPSDRWRWVRNGIHLLRDKGIPANSRDSRLYWELGWLYADKVSGRWDPAQLYYRVSLADEMTELIGGGEFHAERIRLSPERTSRLLAEGLRPDSLAQADEAYGPLDWRLPESHALYWGLRGRPFQRSDARWCDRLVWNALTEMVRGGTLYFEPARKLYLRGPRLDIAIKGARQCERENLFATPLTAMAGENFLREAVVFLYAFGQTAEAEESLAVLKRVPGSGVAPQALDAVVRQDLSIRMKGVDRAIAKEIVEGMLAHGEMWKALGRPAFASGFETLARLHWDAFVSLSKSGETVADREDWADMCRQARDQARRELSNSKQGKVEGGP